MTDRLKNKVALITGAGTRGEIVGIGQASSILMAREGAKILINDIDPERANSTLSQIKDELDLDVELISGAEEARLIYLGILSGMPFGQQPHILLDIE